MAFKLWHRGIRAHPSAAEALEAEAMEVETMVAVETEVHDADDKDVQPSPPVLGCSRCRCQRSTRLTRCVTSLVMR